ncbi:DUF6807 family protein [Kocuria sp. NPDC057446]|uniref:DUF6807 family protein n=1 Tax=Kocuria sp. NPDC057446 TaxID=3346137 RepID=UPI00367A8B3B
MHAQTAPAPTSDLLRQAPARVCLVGIGGFGGRHLANIRRLEEEGRVRLVAAVDRRVDEDGVLGPDVPMFGDLEQLGAAGPDVDVVVISTPIDTHFELALAALRMGADVLLEKPPVANLEQFDRLLEAAEAAGRLVQVGFQSLGSHSLRVVEQILASGEIGRLRAVGATGLWSRDTDYFTRSPWAGRRRIGGVDVVDGVVTNPLAHAVMTALHLAGARTREDVAELRTELYRANAIESDDTSVVRVRTAAGIPVTCALTLCAAEQQDPFITVDGTEGQAVLHYTRDRLTVTGPEGTRVVESGRTNLLENLLDARLRGTGLLCPLASTGAFMRVLDAVRTAPDPVPIGSAHVRWHQDDGSAPRAVLEGVEDWAARAVKAQSDFSGLGAPWASPAATSGSIVLRGREVAQVRTGADIAPTSSPRPFLHPVRTLGGTTVTDQQPLDHVWHLGVGTALQDVDGHNFWGGRTYTREERRYVWRADHGRVDRVAAHQAEDRLDEELAWTGPDGTAVLTEQRRWTFRPVHEHAWELGLRFRLAPAGAHPVRLGSPGSNGRVGGGYGGFFWRLPACPDADVFTAEAAGEDAVHGSTAPWLAFAADFAGRPATLVLRRGDDSADPWFVRHAGYPGVGLALAWDTAVTTTTERPVEREVRVLVVDGRLDAAAVEELLAGAARGRVA